MANIEKRGKTWSVRYWTYDAYGNRTGHARKSGFATKTDAMEAAKSLEAAAAAGIDVHGDSLTCGEIMERWFDSKKNDVEFTTLAKYSNQIDRLQQHPIYRSQVKNLSKSSLGMLIDDLQRGDAAHSPISVRTAKEYTDPLRFALKWAVGEGLIMRNPFESAKLPKMPKAKQVILSEADVDDVIRECKERNPAYLTPLYLAAYGGLCREESAGLVWQRVDFEKSAVVVQSVVTSAVTGGKIEKGPKTVYRSRTVTLPAFVMDHLRLQCERRTSDYVCVSSSGEPYSLSMYARNLNRLIGYANRKRKAEGRALIPAASYHDLRHTHAAMCIALNIQPKVISERLGHGSIKITMDLYGYLMPGLQAQVADALDKKHGT